MLSTKVSFTRKVGFSMRLSTKEGRSLDALVDEGSVLPQEKVPRGLFVPPHPASDALLHEREQYRHALLNRRCLLVALLLAAAAYPIAFVGGGFNVSLVLALSVTNALLLLALWLNSRLWTRPAGLLAVSVMELALLSQTLNSSTHRFDAYTILIFCLFIQPELVALTILGWRSVFVVVGVNSVFMLVCAVLLPPSPEIAALLLSHSWYHIALLVATVHVFLAFTLSEWVRSNEQAIQRADRATEVAKLEHHLAQVEHQRAEEQRHLQEGVEIISQVHARLANGDLNARVPFLTQPALQALSGKLNMLITRYQRALSEGQQMLLLQRALPMLHTLLQERGEAAFPLPATATMLDPFLHALNRAWKTQHRQEAVPDHLSRLGTQQAERSQNT